MQEVEDYGNIIKKMFFKKNILFYLSVKYFYIVSNYIERGMEV